MDRIIRPAGIFLPEGFREGVAMAIEDGIIAGIIPRSEVPGGYEVVDAPGMTASPPFCDRHLHLPKDPVGQEEAVTQLLSCGIFGAYDGGSAGSSGFSAARSFRNRLVIKSCGAALYKKGTYGEAIGQAVSSSDEAERLMDWMKKEGADYLKVINSGIFLPDRGVVSPGGFELRELREIVILARRKGLPVFCHANGDKAIREAVLAGVSAIIHGFFVQAETLTMMADRGVSFIPTISALDALGEFYGEPHAVEAIRNSVEAHIEAAAEAAGAGVSVLPGSDAGPSYIPFGTSFLRELNFFVKAQIPAGQILRAAALHSLKKGVRADFLLLRGLTPDSVFLAGEKMNSGP
jgi:imidazolonepropionase-like amidohydrolase